MYCPYCGIQLTGYIGCFCGSCGSNIQFLAPFQEDETVSDEVTEAGLIHKYFSEGHTYEVILDFLEKKHNIVLSLRTLKRRLKEAGLTRRTDYTPIATVQATVAHELSGSGQLLGYRAVWQTLQQKHHLTVKRDDVRNTLSRLDPSGVQLRSRRRTQFWIEVFSDLRERHLLNGTHEHKCLLRYVFLDVLQKELDDYKQFWNNHTIRPVRQSRCPSGKPEAMYHLAHRFGGRECGFPVPQEALHQFNGILPAQHSLCGDDNLQIHFADLERQSGLVPPVNWTTAVQNYISLKNMSLL